MKTKKVKRPKLRIPLPRQVEKPHSTKKGKKGYDRKKEKAGAIHEFPTHVEEE